MEFGSATLVLYSVESVTEKETVFEMRDRNRLRVSVLQSIYFFIFFFTRISCYSTLLGTTAASHIHNCNLSEKSLFSVGYWLLQCRERKEMQNILGLSIITVCDDLRLATSTCQSSLLLQIHTTIFPVPSVVAEWNTVYHSPSHLGCELLQRRKKQTCVSGFVRMFCIRAKMSDGVSEL